MTELEVLVGNLNRLTKLLRLAWSDVANPLLAPFERCEACTQIAQYSVELRRYLLLMGAGLGLRDKRYMAKKRRIGRFTFKEDRQLIRMAATSATPKKAAAIFRTSVDTIERTCRRLGIQLGRDGRELEPKVKRRARQN